MMVVVVVITVVMVVVMMAVMVVMMVVVMMILGQLDRFGLGSSGLLVLGLQQTDGVRDGVQQFGEGLRRL